MNPPANVIWVTPQQVDEVRLRQIIERRVAVEMKVLERRGEQAKDPYAGYIGKYRPPGPGKRKPTFKHAH